jgi:Rrf2 family protein
MKINQKVKYGMACLLELAKVPHDYMESDEIAKKQSIPPAYAHKVLQSMAHMGLVHGLKGAGYKIERPLCDITALQLFMAFSKDEGERNDSPVGQLLEKRVDQALNSFTLQELAQVR